MILPFSTAINGKPTFFVEKILTGLIENGLIKRSEFLEFAMPKPIVKCKPGIDKVTVSMTVNYPIKFDLTRDYRAKIHTLREDKNDRWDDGIMIDFFINCRQPNMYRFAPVLPVVSTQNIIIKWYRPSEKTTTARIYIDDVSFACAIWQKGQEDNPIYTGKGFLEFVNNDGFDTIDDFFAYFKEDFTGKLIHWTDKRY